MRNVDFAVRHSSATILVPTYSSVWLWTSPLSLLCPGAYSGGDERWCLLSCCRDTRRECGRLGAHIEWALGTNLLLLCLDKLWNAVLLSPFWVTSVHFHSIFSSHKIPDWRLVGGSSPWTSFSSADGLAGQEFGRSRLQQGMCVGGPWWLLSWLFWP